MSQLNATASINFAKSKIKWSSLKAHNHRNYYDMKHDKNKRINHNLSKYNQSGTLINYKNFMIKFINPNRLSIQHAKYLNNRQRSRAKKFASPIAFVNHLNHRNCRCGVITLGDHKFQIKLENKIRKRCPNITAQEIKQLEATDLKEFILHFNSHHNNIKIVSYIIHCDETFIHAHAEFMGIPKRTKKGNLQLNFNKSLRAEEQTKKEKLNQKLPNNRTALHRFQRNEDPLIISKALSNTFNVQLTRKNNYSKDDQDQHSLAVEYKSKQSATSKAIKNSTCYLESLNNKYQASLSISASKSANQSISNQESSLSYAESHFYNKSINFDNSAYGEYAQQLSSILKPVIKNSTTNKDWLKHAKGKPFINNATGKKVYNPLSWYAKYQQSKASSANKIFDEYNSRAQYQLSRANSASNAYTTYYSKLSSAQYQFNFWNTSASVISSHANSVASAKSKVTSLHNKTRNIITNTLMKYDKGFKGLPKFYQAENYFYTDDKSLFKRFKATIHTILNKGIILFKKGKSTIERYITPNIYSRKVMAHYINYYDPYFTNNPTKGDKRINANTLSSNELMKQFNYDTEMITNQKEKNKQYNIQK